MQRSGKTNTAMVTAVVVALAGVVMSLAVLNRWSDTPARDDTVQDDASQDNTSQGDRAQGNRDQGNRDQDNRDRDNRDQNDTAQTGNANQGGVAEQNSASNKSDTNSTAPQPKLSKEDAEVVIEAVAAAEDAEFDRALGLWRQLLAKFPNNPSLRINEAVTVLKWIDEANNLLSSGQIQDASRSEQVQQELAEAYTKADATIEGLATLDADGRAALLQAALLEAKARDAELEEADALRLQATEVLAEALRENAAQPILACKFDELIETLGNQELAPLRTDALFASWKILPRNLLLLNRAISTCAEQKDSRLAELLLPSMEYTRPLWSVVQRDVSRIKPEEMLPAVKEAVEAGDWDNLLIRRDLRRWTNVIRGMKPAFTSDGRIVKPDIMALLDTSILNQMANEVESDLSPSTAELTFEITPLTNPASALHWFDYDIDLDVDLISAEPLDEAAGSRITLWKYDDGFDSESKQSLDIGLVAEGMLVAEFFASDEPTRPMLPTSVSELMESAEMNSTVPDNEEATDTDDDKLSAEAIAAANRHNTLQEVLCWGPQGIQFIVLTPDPSGDLQLSQLTESTGLEDLQQVLAASVLDIESDGDLDLVISTSEGVRVFQNNGNRTFEDVSTFSELSEAPKVQRFISVDLDADLDQDLIGIGQASEQIVWLENLRHGQFRSRLLSEESWPTLDTPVDIMFAELDGNSSWDLITADLSGVSIATTRTPTAGTIVPLATSVVSQSANTLAVGDWNNDGFQDLALGTNAGVQLYLGTTAAGWSKPQSLANIDGKVTSIAVADANNDGALDIACIVDGKLNVQLGTRNENGFLAARVRGINDETKGGRINHFAIGTTLELWHTGQQQRAVVHSPVTHFGLGADSAENLRVIFPNGLTQNRESPPVNALVEEIQELKGSCPFVYGWNGERFELMTDLLWAAPLGLQVARGEVIPDRRWEYLAFPGEMVQEKDGVYELRVTEELWEVAYFDHMQLTAIDHPIGTRLFTNEKVGPPQIAQPQLFVSSRSIRPLRAVDSKGRDVLQQLLAKDKKYAKAFDDFICQGLVEPHFVELGFGKQLTQGLAAGRDCRLFLTGWMHPTDTSLNIGISQNDQRVAPEPPSLWVLNNDQRWQCVQPAMGFPGGKPKSIVIDLNDVFLTDEHRIRIASSQQIYWDEAFVDFDTDAVEIAEMPLQIESAELRFRGFSQLLPRTVHEPHWYDYTQVSEQPKWPELSGPFTRFGDVRELLVEDDDRLVVMTSGDEIAIRFSVPSQPVADGMRRDFVLHSTGWDKDADLNTLAGQGSLPLPFKAQSSYPTTAEQQEQYDQIWLKNRAFQTRRAQYFPGQSNATLIK